jgi:hypothetical protein
MSEQEAIAEGAKILGADIGDLCAEHGEGHSGIGWYVWNQEYPEDGSVRVDED